MAGVERRYCSNPPHHAGLLGHNVMREHPTAPRPKERPGGASPGDTVLYYSWILAS